MSIPNLKDIKKNQEEPKSPFFLFTVGVYNTIISVFTIFIAWLFYSDVVQHLGYTPITFLYFYFVYMLLSCFNYILKSPTDMLILSERAKQDDYTPFSRLYPTVKAFVVLLGYGIFKLIEWIFV